MLCGSLGAGNDLTVGGDLLQVIYGSGITELEKTVCGLEVTRDASLRIEL